jgi:hypothetical protein
VNRYRARGFVLPAEVVRDDDFSQTPEDASWLRCWRDGLLEKGKASEGVLAAVSVCKWHVMDAYMYIYCGVCDAECM